MERSSQIPRGWLWEKRLRALRDAVAKRTVMDSGGREELDEGAGGGG